MELQAVEKQYNDVLSRVRAQYGWLESLDSSSNADLDLCSAEQLYRDVCAKAQPLSAEWMSTQQLRVDLIRQDYQNMMLRSATCQLLTAQSDLKEELEQFRQQYFARPAEKTPRTKRIDDLSRAMSEERMRWQQERKALSEQLTEMMTAFHDVQQEADCRQPVATRSHTTQTSSSHVVLPATENSAASPPMTVPSPSSETGDAPSHHPKRKSSSSDLSFAEGPADGDGHLACGEETTMPTPSKHTTARKARMKKRTRAERIQKRKRFVKQIDSDSSDEDSSESAARHILDASLASHRSASSPAVSSVATEPSPPQQHAFHNHEPSADSDVADDSMVNLRRTATGRSRTTLVMSDSSFAAPAAVKQGSRCRLQIVSDSDASMPLAIASPIEEGVDAVSETKQLQQKKKKAAKRQSLVTFSPSAKVASSNTSITPDSSFAAAPRPSDRRRRRHQILSDSDASLPAIAPPQQEEDEEDVRTTQGHIKPRKSKKAAAKRKSLVTFSPSAKAASSNTSVSPDSSLAAATTYQGKHRRLIASDSDASVPEIVLPVEEEEVRVVDCEDKVQPSADHLEDEAHTAAQAETQSTPLRRKTHKRKKAAKRQSLVSFSPSAKAVNPPDSLPSDTLQNSAEQLATMHTDAEALEEPLSYDASPKTLQTCSAREAFGALLPSPIIEEDEENTTLSRSRAPSRCTVQEGSVQSRSQALICSTPSKRLSTAATEVSSPNPSSSPVAASKKKKSKKTKNLQRALLDSSASSLDSTPITRSLRLNKSPLSVASAAAASEQRVDESPVLSAMSSTSLVSNVSSHAPTTANTASDADTALSPQQQRRQSTSATIPHSPRDICDAASLVSVNDATASSLSSAGSELIQEKGRARKLRRSLNHSKSFSAALSKMLPGASGKSAKQQADQLSKEPPPSQSLKQALVRRRSSLRLSKAAPSAKENEVAGSSTQTGKKSRRASTSSADSVTTPAGRRESLRRGASFRVLPSFPEVPAKSRFAVAAEEQGNNDDDEGCDNEIVDRSPATLTPSTCAAENSNKLSVVAAKETPGPSLSPNGCISFGPRRVAKLSSGKPAATKRRTTNHSQRIAKLLEVVQKTPDFEDTVGQSTALLQQPSVVVWQVSEADAQSTGGDAGTPSPLPPAFSEESMCPVEVPATGAAASAVCASSPANDDDDVIESNDMDVVLYEAEETTAMVAGEKHAASPVSRRRSLRRSGKRRSASASAAVADGDTPRGKRKKRVSSANGAASPTASPVIAACPLDTAPAPPSPPAAGDAGQQQQPPLALQENTNARKRTRSVGHKPSVTSAGDDADAAGVEEQPAGENTAPGRGRSMRRGIKRSKSLKTLKTPTQQTGRQAAAAATAVIRDTDGFEVPGALVDPTQKANKQPSVEKRRRLSHMLAGAPSISPVPGKANGVNRRRSILRNSTLASRESMVSMCEPNANSTRLSMDGAATGSDSRRQSVAFSTLNSSQAGTGRRRTLFSQRDNTLRGETSLSMFGASMADAGKSAAGTGGRRSASSSSHSLTQKQSMQMMMGLFRTGFKAPTVRGSASTSRTSQ
ncbi:mucin-17-like [Sycon ciliatum]|uniref:mucin-17-like n=1 Tax=Sycon ciliatum TaxID=27933 RepID=UPI0031F6E3BB